MIHGTETWAIKKTEEIKLDAAEMRMLRWMCGVTRRNKIRNELEFERLAVEREKAQLALREEAAEKRREFFEMEKEKEREKFEMENAELEFPAREEREKFEREKAKLELEASITIKVEPERASINLQNRQMEEELSLFDLTKNIKLVHSFREYDSEDYFWVSEKTANHLNWSAEQWVWLLKPKLSGKAAQVVRHLDDTKDYNQVKKAILDAFSITEEGYRQAFCNLCKSYMQTFLEFASDKLRAIKKLLKYAEVTSLEELMNLMVLEEFKWKLPINVMLYIEDRQEKDLLKAASLADTYSLIYKSIPNKRAEIFSKPVLHVQANIPDVFDDFKYEGIIALGEKKQKSKVTILRNTGAALTLLHSKALLNVENNLTGEKVVARDLTGISSIPLANVYLDCPLVKGKVELGVIDTELPVKGVSLLLGNDLAGKLIVPN
ncbi:uncharacterized protein [Palaemon carinicauda]|uniref:uncharacterized protein n=1 Tax=Palaemon carinicauda TaxID=392227 RepID=UPI0035B5F38E